MYVCNCHGINEKSLQKSIKNGRCSLKKLQGETSVATGCGMCAKDVRNMLKLSKKQAKF